MDILLDELLVMAKYVRPLRGKKLEDIPQNILAELELKFCYLRKVLIEEYWLIHHYRKSSRVIKKVEK